MNRSYSILHFIVGLMLSCMILGCKKEDPTPENLDPIFKDLSARHSAYTKNLEESKAKIPTLEESLRKAEARTIEVKNFQKELAKEKLKLMNADQLSRYYRIRAERRRLVARLAYKKAFAADKPWPDPQEFLDYQTNLRLQESNRNWATRVPKLADRQPGSQPAAAKPAGGEHGAAPAPSGH